MGHPHPLPSDPATAIPLVDERLRGYQVVVDEFRETMAAVQRQLQHVATSEQVEAMRREVLIKVDSQERRMEAREREALELRIVLQGPSSQPELGLISRFGAAVERLKELEKLRERMIGYLIGAAVTGGGTAALAQHLLTAALK